MFRFFLPLLIITCLANTAAFAEGEEAALAAAAEAQDWPQVMALLESDADPNAPQVDGMTPLHWAVYHDQPVVVETILDHAAKVNVANRYDVTPLSLAAISGNGRVVELLLEAGADPNTSMPGGETVLHTAARTGRLRPVELLIAAGAKVDAADRRGQTPIMWAAAAGHADVVTALIDAGADFQTPLPSGFTPFFFAVREGQHEVVQALLDAGVDVNAAMEPRKGVAKGPERGMSALLLAAENGHFELAVALLKAGADPNDERSGIAPLHAISWVRKPNRGDGDDGDPPPIGSGQLSSLEFVKELVARGADMNLQLRRGASGRGILSRRGATPFLLACVTADVPLMRTLIELGADPLLPNAQQATPLMAAAGVGTRAPGEEAGTEDEVLEAVKLCLKLGGDVNGVDDNGETAMHGAAYKNLPRVVQLLDARGAKLDVWNRKNKYGWTPLLIAQGFRVGNFKPSTETIAAIEQIMRAAGVTPPPPPKRQDEAY